MEIGREKGKGADAPALREVETRLLPWMRLLRRVSEAEAAAEVLGAEEATVVVVVAATELERAATHAMARWLVESDQVSDREIWSRSGGGA